MFKFWKKRKQFKKPANGPDWLVSYYEQTAGIDDNRDARSHDFAVIDLEATGLDKHKDKIISFGFIPLRDFEIWPGKSFQCYIKQTYFDKETIPIHGILHEDIKDGLSEKEFLESTIPRLSGKVIVGHHVGYDIAMINQALLRHFDAELINPTIDTGVLYKKAYPSKFIYNKYQNPIPTLDEIAAEFEIKTRDRHSAMGDALTTAFIFMKLWRESEDNQEAALKDLL